MTRFYLFLQGPHGPFFQQLGRRLRQAGHEVLRVNFNGGDRFDWLGPTAIDFLGSDEEWSSFCEQLFQENRVTDLVLYGDCRSRHRIAIELAQSRGIRIHAFEEGYLRPDWITLEEDGVNGHSTMPTSPEWYLANASESSVRESCKVGRSMRWRLLYCLRYYSWKTLLSRRFKAYVGHRPYRPCQELLLWLSHLLRMPLVRWRSGRRLRQLAEADKPYFLFGLQLDSDAQLKVHSPFLSVAESLSTVLKSFANHAPKDSLLVIKKHPLDPGAVSYETLSMIEAYSLNIRDRVIFLHSASLPNLLQSAEGVVVVNSTMGTSALHHGRPTITLGEAVYDMAGLTWQDGLDSFWTKGAPPDRILYQSFRAHLLSSILINGGFFAPRGRKLALDEAARRLASLRYCPVPREAAEERIVSEAFAQKRAI